MIQIALPLAMHPRLYKMGAAGVPPTLLWPDHPRLRAIAVTASMYHDLLYISKIAIIVQGE